MFKRLLILLAGVVFLILGFCYLAGVAQNTNPASIEFPVASFAVTDRNISGTALDWSGWNLSKQSLMNKPIQARVIVEARDGLTATYNYTVNYFGRVYSRRHYGKSYAAFWIPDSAALKNSLVPDSLFYIVPDSSGMAAGDEFYITSAKITQGSQYVFRLRYSSPNVSGTGALSSQPVWIGYGVKSMVFGYQPADTVAALYRSLYSTSHAGYYASFVSSDTLADSAWTIAAEAGTWNYKAVTGIDNMPWMKVERIGLVAADTVSISGENLIIQSE